jgi:hypothetical protein
MREQLIKEIKSAIIENLWYDIQLVVRAMFTTLVYLYELDELEQKKFLAEIYSDGVIYDLDILCDEFIEFMTKDIKK